jgi:putative phosphoribosyl transferase
MAMLPFRNRTDAGRRLCEALGAYARRDDVLVLALPRGGVPVAAEVAVALELPLDLMVVRKLGLPGNEELAMGAIASGGALVLNQDVLNQIPISARSLEQVMERERLELDRREHAYRGDRPPVDLNDHTILLVDDGVATGATMRAAVAAARQQGPRNVVVAVPVAPPDTVDLLRSEASDVVVLATPEPFFGVGNWYEDFTQTSDGEVRALLSRLWQRPPVPPGGRKTDHGRSTYPQAHQ